MKYKDLFELAEPYLKKNDFGMAHTQRVFNIAKENFDIPRDLEDLTFAVIILHDIGGSTIKEQYEKGPKIATSLLRQLDYSSGFIKQVCEIIRTHHDHPETPLQIFRILYDSDRLVMFSLEEFPYYNSKDGSDWGGIIDSMYSEEAKNFGRKKLQERIETV